MGVRSLLTILSMLVGVLLLTGCGPSNIPETNLELVSVRAQIVDSEEADTLYVETPDGEPVGEIYSVRLRYDIVLLNTGDAPIPPQETADEDWPPDALSVRLEPGTRLLSLFDENPF